VSEEAFLTLVAGGCTMSSPDASPAKPAEFPGIERNRVEVMRFPSDEECARAIGAVLQLGPGHPVTSYDDPNEWWVRTELVRKLRALGLQFTWLTENA
jgi:hypothetical protein